MTVRYFEELEIWKEARRLTREIYRITKTAKFARDFSLARQIRRAAISIMSNIAEGFERGGNQEFIQFLYIAKGSCGEVRSQVYIAYDQGYLVQVDADEIIDGLRRLSIMISNFIAYIQRSGMRGRKFTVSSQLAKPTRIVKLEPRGLGSPTA